MSLGSACDSIGWTPVKPWLVPDKPQSPRSTYCSKCDAIPGCREARRGEDLAWHSPTPTCHHLRNRIPPESEDLCEAPQHLWGVLTDACY